MAELITKPTIEIFVLYVGGVPAVFFELDTVEPRETKLCYFGLVPDFIGRGYGPYMLQAAIERAWQVGRGNSNPFGRRYNVLPTSEIPILRANPDSGALELAEARWGLIPPWWKQAKPPAYSINARAEEAAAKPMWRHAFRHSRCLIPAEGWYEWQAAQRADPASGEVGAYKRPPYLFARDRKRVCFPGQRGARPL